MVNIGVDWILYTKNIDYFRRNFYFSEDKKQNRYIIMNFLSFSMTSIFHVIIVEKQLIKHDILAHCLTCNFRHLSQYNSFPSVWRGLTEHRQENPVYVFLHKINICVTQLIKPHEFLGLILKSYTVKPCLNHSYAKFKTNLHNTVIS